MGLASEICRTFNTGDGTQSEYDYGFPILDETHLKVTVVVRATGVETDLTLNVDFEVSDVGEDAGGVMSLIDADQAWIDVNGYLSEDYDIVQLRVLPATQETDLTNQGTYHPEDVEKEFDRCKMIAQQHNDQLDRAVKLPKTKTSADFDPTLPKDIVGKVSYLLATNDTGDGFDLPISVPDLNAAVAATAASEAAAEASEDAAALSATAAAASETAAAASEAAAAVSAAAAATSAAAAAGVVDPPIKTITFADSPYVVDPALDYDLLVNALGGVVVITAFAAAGNSKKRFRVKKIDNSANAVNVGSADNIDGAATFPISDQYDAYEFKTDGVTFYAY